MISANCSRIAVPAKTPRLSHAGDSGRSRRFQKPTVAVVAEASFERLACTGLVFHDWDRVRRVGDPAYRRALFRICSPSLRLGATNRERLATHHTPDDGEHFRGISAAQSFLIRTVHARIFAAAAARGNAGSTS